MMYDKLLAKSIPKKEQEGDEAAPPSVEEHCRTVSKAAMAIWEVTDNDLSSGLGDHVDDIAGLKSVLRVAALLHDIGKANTAFQEMVRWKGQKQPVRHEVLSAIIVWSPEYAGAWLKEALGDDFWPTIWAIGGHHLQLRQPRFGEIEDPVVRTDGVGNRSIEIYLGHGEVEAILGELWSILKESGRSVPDRKSIALGNASFTTDEDHEERYIGTLAKRFVRAARDEWRSRRHDVRLKRRTAILKSLLIAADVAGSALSPDKTESSIREDLTARIDSSCLSGIVDDLKLRTFQKRVRDMAQEEVVRGKNQVMVIEAGCGNGKTSAAYLWAQQRAINRKLFFCYPTTGTTSAGYTEYLDDQKLLQRDLLHSRASVDRLAFQTTPDETSSDVAQKAESLRAWGQQVIACTVDQVLGLIQNNRRPLFASPAIMCGAFVFDEVHSYDERLFRELLRFLDTFPGVPTLLMSASIPPARRDALKQLLGGRMTETINGDEKLEKITRYQLERRDDVEACWERVADAIADSEKILWVCNTVADAVEIYRQAGTKFPDVRQHLYHSRFRYGGDPDGRLAGWPVAGRVELQSRVIDEFAYKDKKKTKRKVSGAAIAITTQVCEMSLDLDADLLVTAHCPLPSLVQRLGRLHRFAYENDPNGEHPRECLVYPFDGRPYHTGDAPSQMQATESLLDKHAGKPISQLDLAQRLKCMHGDVETYAEPIYSAWLDGGWQSEPLPTREGSNSITVLSEVDIERTASALGKPAWQLRKDDVLPLTMPMLIKRGFKTERRVAGYPVVPQGEISYNEQEGASWAD